MKFKKFKSKLGSTPNVRHTLMKIPPPEGFEGTDHIDSHITTLSCVPVHYRIPTSSIQGIENSMVYGVLSPDEKGKARRDSIRKTWGKGNTLFFIVSGPWDAIEEEYIDSRDLMWVEQTELFRDQVSDISPRKGALTFKSEAYFVAMHDLVVKQNPGVKYFFKTDDDCYINVKSLEYEIQEESKRDPIDYWGECHDHEKPIRNPLTRYYVSFLDYPYTYYPKFCTGPGYVVSPKFLRCAVGEGHIQNVPYLTNEDGATGLLAEKCGMEPKVSTWITLERQIRDDFGIRVSVQHNVFTEELMIELHESALNTPI